MDADVPRKFKNDGPRLSPAEKMDPLRGPPARRGEMPHEVRQAREGMLRDRVEAWAGRGVGEKVGGGEGVPCVRRCVHERDPIRAGSARDRGERLGRTETAPGGSTHTSPAT